MKGQMLIVTALWAHLAATHAMAPVAGLAAGRAIAPLAPRGNTQSSQVPMRAVELWIESAPENPTPLRAGGTAFQSNFELRFDGLFKDGKMTDAPFAIRADAGPEIKFIDYGTENGVRPFRTAAPAGNNMLSKLDLGRTKYTQERILNPINGDGKFKQAVARSWIFGKNNADVFLRLIWIVGKMKDVPNEAQVIFRNEALRSAALAGEPLTAQGLGYDRETKGLRYNVVLQKIKGGVDGVAVAEERVLLYQGGKAQVVTTSRNFFTHQTPPIIRPAPPASAPNSPSAVRGGSAPERFFDAEDDARVICSRARAGCGGTAEERQRLLGPRSITSARAGGLLSQIRTFAHAVGPAGLALLGPALIVYDIINSNPVGAALSGIAITLGAVAVAMGSAPMIGWIMGGLAIFFSILPGFLEKVHGVPHRTEASKIIQWVMFGDAEHTGNEKCRQGMDGQPGNPNCTVQYGPGLIARAFGWGNFEASVLLLHRNKGYPMNIPEMAEAFRVVGRDGSGSDAIATIRCKAPPSCPRFDCGRDQRGCYDPKFELKLDRITLPVINQTADKILERLLPKAGGDCKLVADVTTQYHPAYDFTLTGQPVAVACNLVGSDGTNDTAAMIAAGAPNASTDSRVHHVAPPPPSPFATVLNATNALCLLSPQGELCLPNGTYEAQADTLGFRSSRVNGLAMPGGAQLAFTLREGVQGRYQSNKVKRTYLDNRTDDGELASDMGRLSAQTQEHYVYHVFDALVPAAGPPVVCLFTELNFRGDVACYGPGGGNLTGPIADRARSLAPHGGAMAWIYSQTYGDAGGQPVRQAIPDLSKEDNGNENFDRRVKALWVASPYESSNSLQALLELVPALDGNGNATAGGNETADPDDWL
ncbi:MAG: hypothetical protein M1832_000765 [Thelocarpon impressellum]|nr:MAG: hypothetical protein M1832_000765 [Thelocarpon impressellum]